MQDFLFFNLTYFYHKNMRLIEKKAKFEVSRE